MTDLERRVDNLEKIVLRLLRDDDIVRLPLTVTPVVDDGADVDPPAQGCTHQHQSLVGGNVVCQRCGEVLVAGTGVQGSLSQEEQEKANARRHER